MLPTNSAKNGANSANNCTKNDTTSVINGCSSYNRLGSSCSLCTQLFTETIRPKVLSCKHTLCTNCLENKIKVNFERKLMTVVCPFCHHFTVKEIPKQLAGEIFSPERIHAKNIDNNNRTMSISPLVTHSDRSVRNSSNSVGHSYSYSNNNNFINDVDNTRNWLVKGMEVSISSVTLSVLWSLLQIVTVVMTTNYYSRTIHVSVFSITTIIPLLAPLLLVTVDRVSVLIANNQCNESHAKLLRISSEVNGTVANVLEIVTTVVIAIDYMFATALLPLDSKLLSTILALLLYLEVKTSDATQLLPTISTDSITLNYGTTTVDYLLAKLQSSLVFRHHKHNDRTENLPTNDSETVDKVVVSKTSHLVSSTQPLTTPSVVPVSESTNEKKEEINQQKELISYNIEKDMSYISRAVPTSTPLSPIIETKEAMDREVGIDTMDSNTVPTNIGTEADETSGVITVVNQQCIDCAVVQADSAITNEKGSSSPAHEERPPSQSEICQNQNNSVHERPFLPSSLVFPPIDCLNSDSELQSLAEAKTSKGVAKKNYDSNVSHFLISGGVDSNCPQTVDRYVTKRERTEKLKQQILSKPTVTPTVNSTVPVTPGSNNRTKKNGKNFIEMNKAKLKSNSTQKSSTPKTQASKFANTNFRSHFDSDCSSISSSSVDNSKCEVKERKSFSSFKSSKASSTPILERSRLSESAISSALESSNHQRSRSSSKERRSKERTPATSDKNAKKMEVPQPKHSPDSILKQFSASDVESVGQHKVQAPIISNLQELVTNKAITPVQPSLVPDVLSYENELIYKQPAVESEDNPLRIQRLSGCFNSPNRQFDSPVRKSFPPTTPATTGRMTDSFLLAQNKINPLSSSRRNSKKFAMTPQSQSPLSAAKDSPCVEYLGSQTKHNQIELKPEPVTPSKKAEISTPHGPSPMGEVKTYIPFPDVQQDDCIARTPSPQRFCSNYNTPQDDDVISVASSQPASLVNSASRKGSSTPSKGVPFMNRLIKSLTPESSVIVQVHLSPTLTVQAQLDKIAKCLQTVIKAGFEAKCRVAIALAILSEQAMPGKTVQWLSVYTHKDSRNLDYFSFEVVISRSPVWNYGPASSSCSEHVKEVYHGDYDKFQTHQYDVDLSSVQIALANVLPNSEAKYIDPSTSSESILSHESKSSGRIHDDIKQSIGKLPDATDIIILCDGVSWPFMPRQQHKSTDTSSLLLPEDSTNSNPGIKGRSVSPTSSTFTPDWISFRQKHQNKMFHFVAVGSKSKKK